MAEKYRPLAEAQHRSSSVGRWSQVIRSIVALGTVALACCGMACISEQGENENPNPPGETEESWVKVAFRVTVEPFANEPADTIAFSSGIMNVLKWESAIFQVQDRQPELLDYYGAIGLGPVGRQAGDVRLRETLPVTLEALNESFQSNRPEITWNGSSALLEWSFSSVDEANPGDCSCSAVLFPEVVQYRLAELPIEGRGIEFESRQDDEVEVAVRVPEIGHASKVSIIFSFLMENNRGEKVVDLLSMSEGWETREEGGEILIGAFFNQLEETTHLDFVLNYSLGAGFPLIQLNQETATGRRMSSCGVIVESSQSFYEDLECSAEGFNIERLSYTREAYALPELEISP